MLLSLVSYSMVCIVSENIRNDWILAQFVYKAILVTVDMLPLSLLHYLLDYLKCIMNMCYISSIC